MSKDVIVKRTLDLSKPPVITPEHRARMAALDDREIDYKDIPPMPDTGWVKAVEMPHRKRQVTLRLDADVLDFFQGAGKRYQTRINAVLRSYVAAQRHV